MLKTRVLTAALLVPLTLGAMFLLEPQSWAALTLVVIAIAATEWANLAGYPQRIALPFAAGAFLIGVGLLLAAGDGPSLQGLPLALCGAATLFWIFVAPAWLKAGWRVESKLALALLGWLVLIATWVAVAQLQARSPWLLLALLAVVWIADTAAYFVGRAFGRHKLAPTISPGKTWEGVWGALVATGVYALILWRFSPEGGSRHAVQVVAIAAWIAAILGLAALSIVGDLFESLLKRQRGVKDSGKLLPGHGGVLDRIDALIAAMPAAALVAQYALQ
jgi:phosphatidate cytidylyltransferase